MPSKNCDFCNFCDFSKNFEKFEKSQFLLKLMKSSGKGDTTVCSKNCDFCNFSKNCKKFELVLCMISMYEINVMVFLHPFILHGIRPIAEIVGMFLTDLRSEKKIRNTGDDPW